MAMAEDKIPVKYKDRQKRILRSESVAEVFGRIKRQFSLTEEFSLKAKIGDRTFDIETQDDVEDMMDADELLVYDAKNLLPCRLSSSHDDRLVKIDGEQFRLDAFPRPNTKLVQSERQLIIRDLAIPSMVTELHEVKSFLYIAFLGTRNSTEVHIKVQEVGFTVAKLCEKSKQMLVSVSSKCLIIMEKLQDAFRYLFEEQDDMALLNFKDITDISKTMTLALSELKELFDEGVQDAQRALVITQHERSAQEDLLSRDEEKRTQTTQEKDSREKGLVRIKELVKFASEELDEKTKLLERATARERRVEVSKSKSVMGALNEFMGHQEQQNASVVREKEVKEAVEQKTEVMKQKVKTSELLRKCIHDLENLDERRGRLEHAVEALHEAVTGLKGLSNIVFRAGEVFMSLSGVVDDMVRRSDSLKDKVTASAHYEETNGQQLCQSETFKLEAIKCLSKWVAVEDICSSQKREMEDVTRRLHTFLRENPTREEAVNEMRVMCAEFERHLQLEKRVPEEECSLNPGASKTSLYKLGDQGLCVELPPQAGTYKPGDQGLRVELPPLGWKTDEALSPENIPVNFNNLYVKCIHKDVDDDRLKEMFQEFGPIVSAKVKRDVFGKSKLFGFVCFQTPAATKAALEGMHGKQIDGVPLYVQPHQPRGKRQAVLKERFKEHFKPCEGSNLYVKNLDEAIDDERLREEFAPFGTITSAKVERNYFGDSMGFGYVCFATTEEANRAIIEMNCRIVADKALYVAHHQRREERWAQLTRARSQPNLAAALPVQLPQMPAIRHPIMRTGEAQPYGYNYFSPS